MNNTFLDLFIVKVIMQTPWWAFVAFVYILLVGIRGFWKRTFNNITTLFFLPIVFTGLSVMFLYQNYGFNLHNLNYFLLAYVIGILIGFTHAYKIGFIIDEQSKKFIIPGSFLNLILMLTIFAKKYYFGYKYAIDATLKDNFFYMLFDLIFTGLVLGMLMGRPLFYAKKYTTLIKNKN